MQFHVETGKHVEFSSELKGRVTFFRSRDMLFFTLRKGKQNFCLGEGGKRYVNFVIPLNVLSFTSRPRGRGVSKQILILRRRVREISL